MKAFTSFRREFKALYKPRPAGISARDEATPLELEGTSRPGSAISNFSSEAGLAESDYRSAYSPSVQVFEGGPSSHQSDAGDEESSPKRSKRSTSIASVPKSRTREGVKETEDAAEVALPDSRDDENQEDSPNPQEEEKEAPVLTFEEAQAIRNTSYLHFEGEDESDYTQGPVRFIFGSDGVQECGALLMTMTLSKQIQRTIREQHEFERAELAALRQDQAYSRFDNKIGIEVANCRSKRAGARGVDAEKEAAMEQQIEILELLQDDIKSRQRTMHMNLGTQAEELRNTQAVANAIFEEAFVCARLIEDGDKDPLPKVEELDLETEYAAFCERLKNAYDDTDMVPAAPPLDTSRDNEDEIPVLTEEEQAHQDIINALWVSKETLDQARRDFEEREILRAQEYQANAVAFDRGEPTTDDSPEAFDVRWVKRYGELTRALIDAEAAYAEVKRTAFDAGMTLPFVDNETVFEGMITDGVGYTVSKEQELVDSVPSPTVRQWLSKVPEDISVGSPADQPESEAGEWEAEEVGISDSVSLVAEGKERARIDRWRKACDAEKQQ